jgi:DNA-binding SARP family transcriptional activator
MSQPSRPSRGRLEKPLDPRYKDQVDFRILGSLEVTGTRGAIVLPAAKQRTILGALLLRPNEVVSQEQLADELWGERKPPSATKLVQTYIGKLRSALESGIIETRPPGYLLHLEEEALDAARFRRLVGEARHLMRAGEPMQAVGQYYEALRLWRGPALADVTFESLARDEVERLEEERLVALMGRIDCELLLGQGDELVPELQTLVTRYPLRERPRAQLMLALYRSGRQADALELYAATRRMLRDELGLEPSPRLQELEREVLRHDPRLEPPAAPPRRQEVPRRKPHRLRDDTYASLLSELAAQLGDFGRMDAYADSAFRRMQDG